MREPSPSFGSQTSQIGNISTRLSIVAEPGAIIQRYGGAIRAYLDALLGPDGAEDVAGEMAVKILQGEFAGWGPGNGRFRDYLKTAVHHAAIDWRRRQARERRVQLRDLSAIPDPADPSTDLWLQLWRGALLSAILEKLKAHEERHTDNVFYTVVRILAEGDAEKSSDLARRLTGATGRDYGAANARKQAERARKMLTRLLLEEVGQTLPEPTPQQVEDELRTLGLLRYVVAFAEGPDDV